MSHSGHAILRGCVLVMKKVVQQYLYNNYFSSSFAIGGLIFLLASYPLISANASSESPDKLDLIQYVSLSLERSDAAFNLKDTLIFSGFDVLLAENQFQTHLIPLANFGVSTTTGTQTLGIEARRTNEFGTTFSAGVVGTQFNSNNIAIENDYSTRAFIRLSQGLFRRWGRDYNRSGLTAAEIEQRKAQMIARKKRQDIILSSVRAFYQSLLSFQLVDKTEQALTRVQKHLESARARQSVGLVSMVDVYRAELALLDMENNLKDQRRIHVRNMEDLHERLALELSNGLIIERNITRITPVIPEDWAQRLLEYRPDWQVHIIEREKSRLSMYRSEQNLLPDLSLNVLLEKIGVGNSIEDASKLEQNNWAVQLELASTLDKLKEKTELARERNKTARLVRNGRALKRHIQREARDAFEDIVAEDRRHRISRERFTQAEKALELSKIRYQRGLSSNLDVLDSEVAYSKAELDILNTLVAYNIAAVRLGRSLGILDLNWLKISLKPIDGADKK